MTHAVPPNRPGSDLSRLYLLAGHVWAGCSVAWFVMGKLLDWPEALVIVGFLCAGTALYCFKRSLQK